MARGAIAKDNVTQKIMQAFGADFAGVADKKIYVWADENGERVQVAISMTCPKMPVVFDRQSATVVSGNIKDNTMNFEETSAPTAKVEMGEDEKATLERLMAELGL